MHTAVNFRKVIHQDEKAPVYKAVNTLQGGRHIDGYL